MDNEELILDELMEQADKLQEQDFVMRFQGRRMVHQQSIAEHMAHVTQYLLLLFSVYDVPEHDQLLALKRACTHDLPETETSDIPYPTHVMHPAFSEQYDHVEQAIWHDKYPHLDNTLQKGSSPWKLVKVADKMDVLAYIRQEQMLGNTNDYLAEAYKEGWQKTTQLIRELSNEYKAIR